MSYENKINCNILFDNAGLFGMERKIVTLTRTLVLLIFMSLFSANTAFGEAVTLKLKNGDLEFKGSLLSFDGKFFKLQTTQFGQISVDADKFQCITRNCGTLLEIFLLISKNAEKKGKKKQRLTFNGGNKTSVFNIHGSSTVGTKLMPALLASFAKRNGFLLEQRGADNDEKVEILFKRPNGKVLARINLKKQGSSTAFSSLQSGEALIGMASRRIKEEEVIKLKQAGIPNMRDEKHEHVIGVDGILVLVSPKNTVTSLTMTQLAKIFSGEIRDWAEVGGQAGAINVYTPSGKSGTWSTFKSLVLKPLGLRLTRLAKKVEKKPKIAELVSADANGIGITGFAYRKSARAISIATSCGIVHSPTQFNVSTGEYPLARRLYLYTTNPPTDKYAKHFLTYAKDVSSTVSILRASGFISRNLTTQPFHEQGKRMAGVFAAPSEDFNIGLMRQLARELRYASRLSFTVRFRPNSSNFNAESHQQFKNLRRFLTENKMQNNYFILAGFSDSAGGFDANLKLSASRAEKVYVSMLRATGGVIDPAKIIVKSYGELLPVACNDTETGRARNRRVEVWTVRPEHWPAGAIAKQKQKQTDAGQLTRKFPTLLSQ